jgi:hypothetical protein
MSTISEEGGKTIQEFNDKLFQDYNKAPWTQIDLKVLQAWNSPLGVLNAMILPLAA